MSILHPLELPVPAMPEAFATALSRAAGDLSNGFLPNHYRVVLFHLVNHELACHFLQSRHALEFSETASEVQISDFATAIETIYNDLSRVQIVIPASNWMYRSERYGEHDLFIPGELINTQIASSVSSTK